MIRLLVVSQHAITREGIRALMAKTEDIEMVGNAENIMSLPGELADARPDVTLVEVSAPSNGALRELAYVLSSIAKIRMVVLSDIEDTTFARAVLGLGVVGYVLMHSDKEQLLQGIREAARNRRFVDPQLGDLNGVSQKRG